MYADLHVFNPQLVSKQLEILLCIMSYTYLVLQSMLHLYPKNVLPHCKNVVLKKIAQTYSEIIVTSIMYSLSIKQYLPLKVTTFKKIHIYKIYFSNNI